MNRIATRRRALLLAVAATLAAPVLAACSGNDMDSMKHGGSTPITSAPAGATFNQADVTFAQMMIPHHQQAVEMATLAETRASDAEVKQLASEIKAAQDPEIRTMTGWLTAWGKPTAQPGGHNMPGMSGVPGMMPDQEMAQLRTVTGVDFDRMFNRTMIAHHNGAIEMAREERANGKNADAKSLAATIERSQAAEVRQMQKILDRL